MKKHNSKYYWIVFMIITAVFTFAECVDFYKDIKATSWPITTGNLSRRSYSSGPHNDPFAGYVTGPLRMIEIEFSYKVDGLQYTSNNKSFGLTFSDDFELSNIDDKNLATVKVYFNPLDPREAILLPGPKAFNIGLIVLGAISLFWLMKQVEHERGT